MSDEARIMARPRKPKPEGAHVKSATRVLDILEYFDRIERPATVSEISRALEIPQSSTSMLVGSLIDRGYLADTADGRAVVPTARVPLLGRWVDVWVTDGRIAQMMHDLSLRTGETVLLGIATDIVATYIDAIPATKPMRLHITRGTVRPLATSGMGVLLLSGMSEAEVEARVARVNRFREGRDEPLVDLAAVRAEIAAVRARGYSLSTDRVVAGAGIVGVLLPASVAEQPIGLGLGGLSSAIEAQAASLVAELRAAIARHLG